MKLVDTYGKVIICIFVAVCAIGLLTGFLTDKLKEHGELKDTEHLSSNEALLRQGKPVLDGLMDEDGTAKTVLIQKGDEWNPRILASAKDKTDGDLTGKIKIYIMTVQDNQEKKTLFTETYLDTTKEKEYDLLYTVKNSKGLKAEGRAKVLVTKYKENQSEES